MSESSAYEEFDQGRRAPFTMLGDWVAVSGIDPNARSTYWDIKAHVNENRGTGTAWPPREFLALLAGDRQARTMDPYLRQLEAINAIGAERERSIAKMRSRNLYKIHDTPPRGWDGPSSHAEVWEWKRLDEDACREYYADRKAWLKDIEGAWTRVKQEEKKRGAKASAPVSKEGHRAWLRECRRLWAVRRQGKPTSPRSAVQRTTENPGVSEVPAGPSGEGEARDSGSAVQRTTQCGTAHPGSAVQRTGTTSKGNKKEGDASPTRSVVDERSSSTTCSSAREAEGGFAASSKDQPSPSPEQPRQPAKTSSSKPKHAREQLDLVRAVRAHFPADLLNGWANPATGQTTETLPNVWELSQAILDALAGDVPAADRTVEQLGARIEQRWNHHGWAEKFYAGQIHSPVGAAVAMVRPLKGSDRYGCANPRCEAGVDVDTKEPCPVCPERLAARKADRALESAARLPVTAARAAQRATPGECEGNHGLCGRPTEPGHDRCAACMGWGYCPECKTRRGPVDRPCDDCQQAVGRDVGASLAGAPF